jgi:hypothetical protein
LVHRSQVWSDLGSGGAALRTVAYFSSGIWDLQQSQELRQKDTALDEISACQMLSLVLCEAVPPVDSCAAAVSQWKVAASREI